MTTPVNGWTPGQPVDETWKVTAVFFRQARCFSGALGYGINVLGLLEGKSSAGTWVFRSSKPRRSLEEESGEDGSLYTEVSGVVMRYGCMIDEIFAR